MLATLTNVSRQPVTVVLDHPAFLNKQSGWQRRVMSFGNSTEDGQRAVTEVRRSFPASLTLMPGESAEDLHAAIAKCSQVPALIARKVLALKLIEEKPNDRATTQQ